MKVLTRCNKVNLFSFYDAWAMRVWLHNLCPTDCKCKNSVRNQGNSQVNKYSPLFISHKVAALVKLQVNVHKLQLQSIYQWRNLKY